MKNLKFYAAIYAMAFCAACQNADQKVASSVAANSTYGSVDSRPQDQIHFLNKVQDNSLYNIPSSAIAKDDAIAMFNKYAADSLTNIKNWQFQVVEINDASYDVNSVFKSLGNGDKALYNLLLIAPVKIDNSVDTIAINDGIDFTYTTPKNPKDEHLKKILATLKTLSKGDIVIISGAVTYVNDKGKVDFSPLFDDPLKIWNLDVLITDIRKSPKK